MAWLGLRRPSSPSPAGPEQKRFKLAAVVINFAHFDASRASPFDATASGFKRGIPKETSRESSAEVG